MSSRELSNHMNTFRLSRQRIKRNRPTVSCTACRARKHKCDRQQPCSGCQKRGIEESCRYESLPRYAKSTAAENGEGRVQSELRQMRTVLDTSYALKQLFQTIDENPSQEVTRVSSACQVPDIIFGPTEKVSVRDIPGALPSRQNTDRIVSAYFNAKYVVVPFIHTHQFRRQHEAFWKDPTSSNILWISILFSIMAVGDIISKTDAANSGLQELSLYIKLSARCLVSGQYHKGAEFSVEALAMHLHARSFHKDNPDLDLSQLHALTVRLAQQRYYHCEMNQFLQLVTPFESEMRRRVWFFIQYYDVLISLEHGLPPLIRGETSSNHHPTNATDDDFDEGSTLRSPRPTTEVQPMLPYVCMSRLLPFLRRIICHAQGFEICSYSDAMSLKAQLDVWYGSIPPCLRIRSIKDSAFTDSNHIAMQQILLELIYTTSITLLHRPFLDSMTYSGHEFETALELCRKNAVRSVGVYVEVDREMQKGGRLHDDQQIAASLSFSDFLMMTIVSPLEFFDCVDLPPVEGKYIVTTLQTAVQLWSKRSCVSGHALESTRLLRTVLANICVTNHGQSHIFDPRQDSNCIESSEVIEDDDDVTVGSDKNVVGYGGVEVDCGISSIAWDDTMENPDLLLDYGSFNEVFADGACLDPT
ncbi:unnamed protein product [Fusarium equiseti]|uniref:Zn(2)-C6 fungal-type domain-containing protein n=1 Tax=Fusarium equiseti TaxID=61235 RepID=A0A8J2ILM8_FUSEQ|nr:unnamed protein product [Fusarium equiseti]